MSVDLYSIYKRAVSPFARARMYTIRETVFYANNVVSINNIWTIPSAIVFIADSNLAQPNPTAIRAINAIPPDFVPGRARLVSPRLHVFNAGKPKGDGWRLVRSCLTFVVIIISFLFLGLPTVVAAPTAIVSRVVVGPLIFCVLLVTTSSL